MLIGSILNPHVLQPGAYTVIYTQWIQGHRKGRGEIEEIIILSLCISPPLAYVHMHFHYMIICHGNKGAGDN